MNKNQIKADFLELMEKHQPIIHHICRIYADSPENYEDMFQEILLQLWKSFETFKQQSKFSTWMYRVALNTAITLIRKEKNRVQSIGIDENIEPDNGYDEDIESDVKHLYQAISQLGKIDKAIILLYLDEKSYDEISEILGISKTNVGVRINRAKVKLEKLLQPYFN